MAVTVYLGWSILEEDEYQTREIIFTNLLKLLEIEVNEEKEEEVHDCIYELIDDDEISNMIEKECGLKATLFAQGKGEIGFYFWKFTINTYDYSLCVPYDKIVIKEETMIKTTQFMRKIGFKGDAKLHFENEEE